MGTWNLRGTYMETCNCAVACPCIFLSDPTQGDCTLLMGWHIDKGQDGQVSLDDLNVAFAVYSPGNMAQVKWDVAVYVDQRATTEQRQSLARIFGGQAGGHPAALAAHVGKVVGMESVPIQFRTEGKATSLKVGEVGEAEVTELEGQGGQAITISGHILAIAPGYPATVNTSKKMRFSGHGYNWSMSGRTSFVSPFSYQG